MEAYANGQPWRACGNSDAEIDAVLKTQLGYILGDTGRSFVVGYGTNPPPGPTTGPHPAPPCLCSAPGSTTRTLGLTPTPCMVLWWVALVPMMSTLDDRNDYIKNEVATDYNAGFTGERSVQTQVRPVKQINYLPSHY